MQNYMNNDYSDAQATYEVNLKLVQMTRKIVEDTTVGLLDKSIALMIGKGNHLNKLA